MDSQEKTQIIEGCLKRWRNGDKGGLTRLFETCYDSDFLPMARNALRQDRGDRFTPEELSHGVWEKLAGLNKPWFKNKRTFFAHLKDVFQQVLLDLTRRKKAKKRGGDVKMVPMDLCSQILDGTGGDA